MGKTFLGRSLEERWDAEDVEQEVSVYKRRRWENWLDHSRLVCFALSHDILSANDESHVSEVVSG